MSIALSTSLKTNFDDAVARTREALAEQGFGVLTEIDVKSTLKAKLDANMENYLILGACNPPLAHRAIGVDRQIGLLLPCNVVVRQDAAGAVQVEFLDPGMMGQMTDNSDVAPVGAEVREKLQKVMRAL